MSYSPLDALSVSSDSKGFGAMRVGCSDVQCVSDWQAWVHTLVLFAWNRSLSV